MNLDNLDKFDVAKRYLKAKGYDSRVFGDFLVWNEDEATVLASVFMLGLEDKIPKTDRKKFESTAFTYLDYVEEVLDGQTRFDVIIIHIINKDRAFIKHLVNAQEGLRDDGDEWED